MSIDRHDDIQGILATALSGVTQYTPRQYRNTGLVYPHIAQSDIFTMTFQMPHRKKLGSAIDSVHLHWIPVASANGDIQLDYSWGWYNIGDTIPDTLPNTGNKVLTLATTDQYKSLITPIITNLSAPASEGYSSILMVKITRVAPAGTNWGVTNELALVYMDAHYITERRGSVNEATDA